MSFPQWLNMPKPKALVTLSWEDVYGKAVSMGHTLTRQQCEAIFDDIDSSDFDCENSTVWSLVEFKIEQYLRDNK